MHKRKTSAEEKITAVNLYLDGKGSPKQIAASHGMSQASFQQWLRNYEAMGVNAFTLKGNKKHPKELKRQAVLDYLSRQGSQDDIRKKYGIRSKGKLQKWIKQYNGHEEPKSSRTGGRPIMTKGRRTTFDERVEIVQYCMAHDHNYAGTSEKHQVSYQQARNYTVKYEIGGVEALKDKRGKRKNPDDMSEPEKLRAEVKILRAEKQRAKMEASFSKKLEETERRRGWAWSVMNSYIRQSKKNIGNIIVPSAHCVSLAVFQGRLTINGGTGKFRKANKKPENCRRG